MQVVNKETNLGLCKDQKLVGRVHIVAKDADGNVVDDSRVTNNIVLGIRNPIIRLLGGWGTEPAKLPFVRQIGLGTGSTPATVLDTQLEEEVEGSRKLAATTPTMSEDGLSLTFSFLYDMVDEAVDNKDIQEMALFTTDNVMIARTTVGLWRKTTGLYFEIYWTIGYAA